MLQSSFLKLHELFHIEVVAFFHLLPKATGNDRCDLPNTHFCVCLMLLFQNKIPK